MVSATAKGKQSIVLDLKSEAGKEAFHRIIRKADIFVQNFRPGAMDRLGIAYDALKEVNPKLIYVSGSGFGQTGPYASKRIYDPVIQSYAGMAATQGTDKPRADAPTSKTSPTVHGHSRRLAGTIPNSSRH